MAKENLFDIVDKYHEQLRKLQDTDQPAECIADTLEAIQWDVETKLRATVAFALQLKSQAEERKAQAKRMAESAKALENRAESLMMYAQVGVMTAGIKLPMVLPEFTLSLPKLPPSLEVTDEAAVPNLFKLRTVAFVVNDDISDELVREVIEAYRTHDGESLLADGEAVEVNTAVLKKPLLDAVKADPEAHKAYARIAPTGYRLGIR